MTKLEQYKCDYCGQIYSDKDTCASCENKHVSAIAIVAQHYHVGLKRPTSIQIEMSDGTVQLYTLK